MSFSCFMIYIKFWGPKPKQNLHMYVLYIFVRLCVFQRSHIDMRQILTHTRKHRCIYTSVCACVREC